MDIQFTKDESGIWTGSYVSGGSSDVVLFRNGAYMFATSYGPDKEHLIDLKSGCFSDGEIKDVRFTADVPAGLTVYMWSASEVTSCTVIEKEYKTTGKIDASSLPSASASKAGLMAAVDKVKLDSVEEGANKYVLQTATAKSTGGIALGYKSTGRNYALQISTDGRGFVNVPWTDTVYTLPQATASVLGGIKLGHVNKLLYEYPVEVDGEGRAYVSVPQRELSGMQKVEFDCYANDYAGIWCTSASDITHMDFVMGDNIDAGNISDTFRWRFTSTNLLGTASSPDKPRESDLHTIMELKPTGKLGGVLSIADADGVMQKVLTVVAFGSLPAADDVTADNVVDVVKHLIKALKG